MLSSDFLLFGALQDLDIEGQANLSAAVQIAQLALKHRQNKNQRQRIVIFIGSPIAEDKVHLRGAHPLTQKRRQALACAAFPAPTQLLPLQLVRMDGLCAQVALPLKLEQSYRAWKALLEKAVQLGCRVLRREVLLSRRRLCCGMQSAAAAAAGSTLVCLRNRCSGGDVHNPIFSKHATCRRSWCAWGAS